MLATGSTLGNYQIVEKVGAGGMGSVYKAYQPALGRYVAIKVLPPQTSGDPAFAARFAQEARAIGKLRHPNIVTAYDFAQHEDLAYLVSDYIDGGTLADQLGSPLPLDYALTILIPIASALDYAHARGVVHRDIKPQNILLTHDGMPVLTDFGLAKIIGPGSGVTQAGALMGTAEYIAPECASGVESAGPASDQYAVGIVAYQLLVGRHPFPSENPISALMAHVHKPVPPPSTLGIALPEHVEAALLRGLAKKPADRFPRVGDFVRALGAPAPAEIARPASLPPPPVVPTPRTLPPAQPELSVATNVPSRASAPPEAAPEPVRRSTPWWRRRRTLLIALGLLVVLVIAAQLDRNRPGGGGATAADDHANAAVGASVVTAGLHPGTLSPAGDVDWFRVNVSAGANIVAELRMETLASGNITLLGPNAQVLDEATEASGKPARVSFAAREPGSYFLRVRAGRAEATGTYSVALTTR